ncbi:PRD domain-containing protein [Bacillus sp. IITD106]|nr:PRD domain-containing protein [Bacillus sp. IITD106]
MNLHELEERLQLLADQQVISPKAEEVTLLSFKRLLQLLGKQDIDQAEMLFTHLPMALTRIENGEKVESPMESIVNQVKNSEHFSKAEEQVACIEESWQNPLPVEEKEFLYMHYTNVINLNTEGK